MRETKKCIFQFEIHLQGNQLEWHKLSSHFSWWEVAKARNGNFDDENFVCRKRETKLDVVLFEQGRSGKQDWVHETSEKLDDGSEKLVLVKSMIPESTNKQSGVRRTVEGSERCMIQISMVDQRRTSLKSSKKRRWENEHEPLQRFWRTMTVKYKLTLHIDHNSTFAFNFEWRNSKNRTTHIT